MRSPRICPGIFYVALTAGAVALGLGTVSKAAAPQTQQLTSPPSHLVQEEDKPDEGIPVTNPQVIKWCGTCHKVDQKKRMTRISYRRTTPEGWQETIKRMVALNNLEMEPADAREVLAYLSDHHGLAPEEVRPAAFEVERRLIDFKYAPDPPPGGTPADPLKRDTEQTCTKCHSIGRVLLQRRTQEEWELLVAMHRGLYPLSDFQAFRRSSPTRREPGPDGRPPDNRHPMDKAIEHLHRAFPLVTPEWSAWSATMRAPRLEGQWTLTGYQLGRGPIFGELAIVRSGGQASDGAGEPVLGGPAQPGSIAAEFTTTARYVYARTGQTVVRQGRTRIYTGFQWRGRSTVEGESQDQAMREVLIVERDWRAASGRWFTGAYDEIGIDVSLTRMGPAEQTPVLLGASQMLRTSSAGQEVRLFGANLPQAPKAADFDFGPGVNVSRVTAATPGVLTVLVDVAANATVGIRDVFLSGAGGKATVAVYDRIDGIKVVPQWGMARVGGIAFPKQLQQFEAVAYNNGPDGKPNTKDDISLGIVDATWSIEEYTATFDDDDKDFVGSIDPKTGLFTPNVDGPNPKRKGKTNNFGDVWAVASYLPSSAPSGSKSLKARAHLLVTVPLYIKWDQPEVAK